jgi:hypothetical protein
MRAPPFRGANGDNESAPLRGAKGDIPGTLRAKDQDVRRAQPNAL